MHIETERLIIRDLEHGDQNQLFKIVRQPEIVRFMRDWSVNKPTPDSFKGYINWHQSQKDALDVYKNKRYAITLKGNNLLIGMVGMGLDEILNEVEMAYFVDEDHQGQNIATEALNALFAWCMSLSELPYLILTIDCANIASCRVAEKAGFELFEKRTPLSHKQPNMISDTYYYYRRYR